MSSNNTGSQTLNKELVKKDKNNKTSSNMISETVIVDIPDLKLTNDSKSLQHQKQQKQQQQQQHSRNNSADSLSHSLLNTSDKKQIRNAKVLLSPSSDSISSQNMSPAKSYKTNNNLSSLVLKEDLFEDSGFTSNDDGNYYNEDDTLEDPMDIGESLKNSNSTINNDSNTTDTSDHLDQAYAVHSNNSTIGDEADDIHTITESNNELLKQKSCNLIDINPLSSYHMNQSTSSTLKNKSSSLLIANEDEHHSLITTTLDKIIDEQHLNKSSRLKNNIEKSMKRISGNFSSSDQHSTKSFSTKQSVSDLKQQPSYRNGSSSMSFDNASSSSSSSSSNLIDNTILSLSPSKRPALPHASKSLRNLKKDGHGNYQDSKMHSSVSNEIVILTPNLHISKSNDDRREKNGISNNDKILNTSNMNTITNRNDGVDGDGDDDTILANAGDSTTKESNSTQNTTITHPKPLSRMPSSIVPTNNTLSSTNSTSSATGNTGSSNVNNSGESTTTTNNNNTLNSDNYIGNSISSKSSFIKNDKYALNNNKGGNNGKYKDPAHLHSPIVLPNTHLISNSGSHLNLSANSRTSMNQRMITPQEFLSNKKSQLLNNTDDYTGNEDDANNMISNMKKLGVSNNSLNAEVFKNSLQPSAVVPSLRSKMDMVIEKTSKESSSDDEDALNKIAANRTDYFAAKLASATNEKIKNNDDNDEDFVYEDLIMGQSSDNLGSRNNTQNSLTGSTKQNAHSLSNSTSQTAIHVAAMKKQPGLPPIPSLTSLNSGVSKQDMAGAGPLVSTGTLSNQASVIIDPTKLMISQQSSQQSLRMNLGNAQDVHHQTTTEKLVSNASDQHVVANNGSEVQPGDARPKDYITQKQYYPQRQAHSTGIPSKSSAPALSSANNNSAAIKRMAHTPARHSSIGPGSISFRNSNTNTANTMGTSSFNPHAPLSTVPSQNYLPVESNFKNDVPVEASPRKKSSFALKKYPSKNSIAEEYDPLEETGKESLLNNPSNVADSVDQGKKPLTKNSYTIQPPHLSKQNSSHNVQPQQLRTTASRMFGKHSSASSMKRYVPKDVNLEDYIDELQDNEYDIQSNSNQGGDNTLNNNNYNLSQSNGPFFNSLHSPLYSEGVENMATHAIRNGKKPLASHEIINEELNNGQDELNNNSHDDDDFDTKSNFFYSSSNKKSKSRSSQGKNRFSKSQRLQNAGTHSYIHENELDPSAGFSGRRIFTEDTYNNLQDPGYPAGEVDDDNDIDSFYTIGGRHRTSGPNKLSSLPGETSKNYGVRHSRIFSKNDDAQHIEGLSKNNEIHSLSDVSRKTTNTDLNIPWNNGLYGYDDYGDDDDDDDGDVDVVERMEGDDHINEDGDFINGNVREGDETTPLNYYYYHDDSNNFNKSKGRYQAAAVKNGDISQYGSRIKGFSSNGRGNFMTLPVPSSNIKNNSNSNNNDVDNTSRHTPNSIRFSPHNYKRSKKKNSLYYRFKSFIYFTFIITSLLVLGFLAGFFIASNKDLRDFEISKIDNVLTTSDELLFDIIATAFNQGLFMISVDKVELDIFAESRYISTSPDDDDDGDGDGDGDVNNNIHNGKNGDVKDLVFKDNEQDNNPRENEEWETILLGTVYSLETPLEFLGGFFSREYDISSSSIKLKNPGRSSTPQDPDPSFSSSYLSSSSSSSPSSSSPSSSSPSSSSSSSSSIADTFFTTSTNERTTTTVTTVTKIATTPVLQGDYDNHGSGKTENNVGFTSLFSKTTTTLSPNHDVYGKNYPKRNEKADLIFQNNENQKYHQWKNLSKYEFNLIIRGNVFYKIPFMQNEKSITVQQQVVVNPGKEKK